MNSKRRIVVLGGGTAGWLTALMAQKLIPNAHITLVESEEIGILGAGEGTTPQFVQTMDFLGIPASRIVKEAGGTFKTAIKFTGWGDDWRQNGYFYHGFDVHEPNRFGEFTSELDTYSVSNYLDVYNNVPAEKLDITAMYSNRHKVPFLNRRLSKEEQQELSDPIFKYESFGSFAMHFNARMLADMFKNIAVNERGVERIEGKVSIVNEDGRGNVASLTLDSGSIVECDFLFDCSGFARLVIGKQLGSEWQSHDILPAKRAVPFFIPMREDENPPAYTEAIAMKYGWVWKIPVEGRYGCGYVFDSDYITEEEAVAEIEEFFGAQDITYPRADKGGFKFNAGYYKEPWKGNVLAVGLASGFIEPLEATSIWVSIRYLNGILANPWELFNRSQVVIDEFNENMVEMNKQIADFIYLHYMGGRDDTEFWQKFKDFDRAPESIKKVIDKWQVAPIKYRDFLGNYFVYISWWQMAYGLKLINKDVIKSAAEENGHLIHLENYGMVRSELDWMSQTLPDHSELLKQLRSIPPVLVGEPKETVKAIAKKPRKKK